MTTLAVVDTTVWSNFAQVGAPKLVVLAFPEAASPVVVINEVREGLRLSHIPSFDSTLMKRIELTPQEETAMGLLEATLDPGEAACVAVAESRNGLLLSDDRIARRLAHSRRIQVSGTVGILLLLVKNGRLPLNPAEELLRRMIEARYRSPISSLTELL